MFNRIARVVACLALLGLTLPDFAASAAPSAPGRAPPQSLVTAITQWLALELGLPGDLPAPAVKLAPARKITTFRHTGLLSDDPRDMADVPRGQRETLASYDSLTRTVLLPEKWTGATVADVSMLVHETVHHLQNVAGLRYECPQASEKPAYEAQEKWLRLYGRDLAGEFELDGFTLLVTTQCFY
jgi:hypothetical protein